MKYLQNDSLVALMNNREDFEIARTHRWYRIPVKPAPPIVKKKELQYIAFYHTKAFEVEKFSIRWYSEVTAINIVKRKELLPNDLDSNKADKEYYRIEFNELKSLPNTIVSRMRRRILFIPTTSEKLFNSTEINYLFNDSPLEEKLWEKFQAEGIPVERQLYLTYPHKQRFILDFAIFCQKGSINIECDGDAYHTEKKDLLVDKKRNNVLESEGWSVLRFTTNQIVQDLDFTYALIKKTIDKYGGLKKY